MAKNSSNQRDAAAVRDWGDAASLPKSKLVVIWDLNHTLVPWYKMKRGKTPEERELFDEWMAFSDGVQNDDLRGTSANWQDAPNVLALGSTVADKVREVYCGTCSIPEAELLSLENDTEKLFDNWITTARSAMGFVEGVGGVNVVLTGGTLKGTIAKLIVFGMAKYVPLELVYSASGSKDELTGGKSMMAAEAIEAGKKYITARQKGKIVVVGGKGKEEEELAAMHRGKFIKVASAKDLLQIRSAV